MGFLPHVSKSYFKSLHTKLLVNDSRPRADVMLYGSSTRIAVAGRSNCERARPTGIWSGSECVGSSAVGKCEAVSDVQDEGNRALACRCWRCLLGLAGLEPGCGLGPGGVRAPSVTKIFSPRPVVPNPIVVPSTDFENVWNKTVAVVDKYFDIESENRLSRTIRTQPQMGATMLEPWALDSATFQDRLEASLQTIRRAAVIHVDPAPTGGLPGQSRSVQIPRRHGETRPAGRRTCGLQQRFSGQPGS